MTMNTKHQTQPSHCAFDATISNLLFAAIHLTEQGHLTLDIGNALIQDLLYHFRILKLLVDLPDDTLCQLLLLSLLDLTLISDP